MEAIPVRVTIEPSDFYGETTWVRSEDQVWWKWYGSRLDACIEAARLGLVNSQKFPSEVRFSQNVRYSVKDDAVAIPDELVRLGFRRPPTS